MKLCLNKFKFISMFLIFGFIILINSKVCAASIGMSINKSSATVGDTFTVTISGINGRVNISGNDKVTISPSGSTFVDGSLTISGTAKNAGTGTITVTPEDVTTTDAEPVEIFSSASRSIQINEKPKVEQNTNNSTNTNKSTASTNTKTNTTTQKKTENKTTKNTTTTSKNTKQNQTKKNEDIVVNKEDQGTKEELLIEDMNVFTIDKEGNKENIKLTPEFDGKITEYTLNVENNTDKLEFDSKYNKEYELKIEGLEEDLKVGENTVKLTLTRDKENKIYTIKVIKEEEKIVDENENSTEKIETKEKNNQKKLTFSVLEFIGIIIGCILIENLIVLSVYKIIKAKKQENY